MSVLGQLQAKVIDQAVPVYDAAKNLRRTRARQFGPFRIILEPIDRLSKPSGAPLLPPATAPPPFVRPMLHPSPPTGTTFPISPLTRPPLPDPNLKSYGQIEAEE
ncbi:hypothetical protein U1701_17415 [Sphingomonas sp. PB2P19]|uniref:hypothetical protein n=1 Tax=Sphingomonas rhamnosi TaxID=3096156 RepID=UPI002FC6B2F1